MLTRIMALRVLLADESVTIKKVFQVALQDFGVEVTPVTIGSDVVAVAERVHPDIVFVDVLLQKKNGYDVCRDLKKTPSLAATPVVLIWSGFMELDQQKYRTSGANDHLEKPFDAQKLRSIITDLVPKTKTQPVAPFVTLPKLPEFDEGPQSVPLEASGSSSKDNWSMESFEPPAIPISADADEFTNVPIASRSNLNRALQNKNPNTANKHAVSKSDDELVTAEDDGLWVQKSLSRFQLEPDKQEDSGLVELNLDIHKGESANLMPPETPKEVAHKPKAEIPQLSEEQLIQIVRAQSKEVIEKVVWQVLPEIAAQVVERELSKLLDERK